MCTCLFSATPPPVFFSVFHTSGLWFGEMGGLKVCALGPVPHRKEGLHSCLSGQPGKGATSSSSILSVFHSLSRSFSECPWEPCSQSPLD